MLELAASNAAHFPASDHLLTIQEGFNIKLLFRRLATALPNLESSAAPPNDPQVINLTAPPPTAAATAAKGGCAAGCY